MMIIKPEFPLGVRNKINGIAIGLSYDKTSCFTTVEFMKTLLDDEGKNELKRKLKISEYI